MAGQPPLQMPQGLPAQPPPIQPQLEIPQLMAPPGGAAPLPIGGTTRRPSTFLEFYQEPLSDPCQGRYANILNRFNPESAHAVAANVLLEQVVGTPPTCLKLICAALCPARGCASIVCTCRLSLRQRSMAEPLLGTI